MSYIIAFISFEDSTKEFPVQCFRTDIKQGDKVIARRADGKLRPAIVQDLKYLNWDCNGRIECKSDEVEHRSDGGIVLPKGSPLVYGISSLDVFIKELKSHGWVPPESVTIPPAPSTAPINIPRCLPTAPPIDANDAQSQ